MRGGCGLALIAFFIAYSYFNELCGYTLHSCGIMDAGAVFLLSGFTAAPGKRGHLERQRVPADAGEGSGAMRQFLQGTGGRLPRSHGHHRRLRTLLIVSAATYLAAHLFSINLSTCPDGSPWPFNTLAYHFILVLGMLFGWNHFEGRLRLKDPRQEMIIAFVFLALVFRDHNFIRYLHRYFQPYLSWYVGASV